METGTGSRRADGEPPPAAGPPGGIPGFLELFSGSARLAEAVRRDHVGWSKAWDIEDGPGFDLLQEVSVQKITRQLYEWHFWMVRLGPPCSTCS